MEVAGGTAGSEVDGWRVVRGRAYLSGVGSRLRVSSTQYGEGRGLTSGHEPAAVLREHGHRATGPRLAVHDVLARAGGHLTADQVAARVDSEVNLATVYRALALLEQVGLVHSVRLGEDGSSSWELAHPDDHAHLVCTSCGTVDHHVGSAVSHLRQHLDQEHGFDATDVDLVVSGTCAGCRGMAEDVMPPSVPASP